MVHMNRLQRLFCITLFMQYCLPVFADAPAPVAPKATQAVQVAPANKDLNAEQFEQVIALSREHTTNIDFCLQNIINAVNSGKIKLSSAERKKVLIDLLGCKELVSGMLNNLYVQSDINVLSQCIVLNNAIINFLHHGVTKGIKNLNFEQFLVQLKKRASTSFSPDELLSLLQQNHVNMEKLIYAADRIDLSWVNLTHRTLKQYGVYTGIKNVAVAGAALGFAGLMLMWTEDQHGLNKYSWYQKYIGSRPWQQTQAGPFLINKPDPVNAGQFVEHVLGDPNAKPNLFQRVYAGLQHGARSSLINIQPLLSVSLPGVASYLLADFAKWGIKKAHNAYSQVDDILGGTKKHNRAQAGYEKVYFNDLVGCQELEDLAYKIATFMKHPERYERAQIEEHRGILLYGPPQTGKTLFAKALRTLIQEELGTTKKVTFIDAKHELEASRYEISIQDIFAYASHNAPCVIFFDEIDLLGAHREKNTWSTGQLLTAMQGMDASKQVIVIGATNRIEKLDPALLVDGRFGKHIYIAPPKVEHRKKFLEKELNKRCIYVDPEYIEHIAQETTGCTYNNLRRIINEAYILASMEKRATNQNDIERTLDTEVRKIQKSDAMSQEEKRIIATYQAGKALARHLLHTTQEVVKITIHPVMRAINSTHVPQLFESVDNANGDNQKFIAQNKADEVKQGEVFTKSCVNNHGFVSDAQQEKECLTLLAGYMALKLMMNQNYTQCNKQDRAEAIQIIYNMISNGEKIDESQKKHALKLKEVYEQKILQLLAQHKPMLEKIIKALMQHETIDRYQWKELIAKK